MLNCIGNISSHNTYIISHYIYFFACTDSNFITTGVAATHTTATTTTAATHLAQKASFLSSKQGTRSLLSSATWTTHAPRSVARIRTHTSTWP